MKTLIQTSVLLISLIFSGTANSQVIMRQFADDSDGIFYLSEIQVIVSSSDDTVVVNMVMPKRMRGKEYQEIVIEEGDKILMVNAKRVKHVDALKKIYDDTKIGDLIKFGIRRKGELFLVDFKKADPESLPKVRIKLMTGGPGDMNMEHIFPVMGTGLILNEVDGNVVVQDKLQGIGILSEQNILKDDIVTMINGKQVKTIGQFRKVYDGLEVDAKVALTYKRNDRNMNLSFKKPETQGRMMLRK